MSGRDFYTTEQAAGLLGVSQRRVQQLLYEGALVRIARGLVDATSVERHRAVAPGARTRAWAEHTAWGAIALLSGVHPAWLGPAQASRLRTTLLGMTIPAELVARLRERAFVRTYVGHPTAASRLRDELVATSGVGLVETATNRVDGYLASDVLDSMVALLGLRADPGGDLVVRTTRFDLRVVADLATHGTVLAAVDAAASLDPRERGVGERAVAEVLARYRR